MSLLLSDTPEYQQSLRMQPACNRVIRHVWGEDVEIQRFDKDDEEGRHILDRQYAIDVQVKRPGLGVITLQEKSLSHEYAKFGTMTMEYFQNKRTEEEGEFFHIAAQYYLSGYSDESGIEFLFWNILYVDRFKEWFARYAQDKTSSLFSNHHALSWPTHSKHGDGPEMLRAAGGSRAAFIFPRLSKIPKWVFFRSSTPS